MTTVDLLNAALLAAADDAAELTALTDDNARLIAENAQLRADLDNCRDPLEPIRGLACWTSNMDNTTLTKVLAMPECAQVSAFARWDQLTKDELNYDWSWFDRALDTAKSAGKKAMLMVILGNIGNGIPPGLVPKLQSTDIVTADGATFPVWWGQEARLAHAQLLDDLAERYSAHPALAQVRATGYWSNHGEPWFMGGAAGKAVWISKYRAAFFSGTTATDAEVFAAMQKHYQQYEQSLWTAVGNRFPGRVRIAMAAGDAYSDAVGMLPNTDPAKHPQRFATWTKVRDAYGDRAVMQFNGLNAGEGASGYGVWVPAAFGPMGAEPGPVMGQPVGGVTAGNQRLTVAQFTTMLTLAATRGNSAVEVYGSDWRAALADTTEGQAIRAALAVGAEAIAA